MTLSRGLQAITAQVGNGLRPEVLKNHLEAGDPLSYREGNPPLGMFSLSIPKSI
jgi:hypothetical protein